MGICPPRPDVTKRSPSFNSAWRGKNCNSGCGRLVPDKIACTSEESATTGIWLLKSVSNNMRDELRPLEMTRPTSPLGPIAACPGTMPLSLPPLATSVCTKGLFKSAMTRALTISKFGSSGKFNKLRYCRISNSVRNKSFIRSRNSIFCRSNSRFRFRTTSSVLKY
ncbi:MAG: Uncharacterised protein [Alphaproteobacteria bacterium]|nr:MAG: Uncharacterised protein [Alphaproteobacteria bacterium]